MRTARARPWTPSRRRRARLPETEWGTWNGGCVIWEASCACARLPDKGPLSKSACRSRSLALHPVLPRRSYGSLPYNSSSHRSGLPPLRPNTLSGAQARTSRPVRARSDLEVCRHKARDQTGGGTSPVCRAGRGRRLRSDARTSGCSRSENSKATSDFLKGTLPFAVTKKGRPEQHRPRLNKRKDTS
jgi:hypothetical protein